MMAGVCFFAFAVTADDADGANECPALAENIHIGRAQGVLGFVSILAERTAFYLIIR